MLAGGSRDSSCRAVQRGPAVSPSQGTGFSRTPMLLKFQGVALSLMALSMAPAHYTYILKLSVSSKLWP